MRTPKDKEMERKKNMVKELKNVNLERKTVMK